MAIGSGFGAFILGLAIGASGSNSSADPQPPAAVVTPEVTPSTVVVTVTAAPPPPPVVKTVVKTVTKTVTVPAAPPAPSQATTSAEPEAPVNVYYANCSEARAAGAAPLYVGDPGYRSGLDGDGDGVACE